MRTEGVHMKRKSLNIPEISSTIEKTKRALAQNVLKTREKRIKASQKNKLQAHEARMIKRKRRYKYVLNIRGELPELRVERLLKLLKLDGKVKYYERTVKYSYADMAGIDFFGELEKKYGGGCFSIDVKSNLDAIKAYQRKRNVLFFSPKDTENDRTEAMRLFKEIRVYIDIGYLTEVLF